MFELYYLRVSELQRITATQLQLKEQWHSKYLPQGMQYVLSGLLG